MAIEIIPTNAHLRDIAIICHAANKAYSEILGESTSSWDSLPKERQEGVIEGVEKAIAGETPQQLHQSWCKSMEAQGFVHGKEKDTLKKTHPCLVPYDKLPAEQKQKDKLFAAIVKALAD